MDEDLYDAIVANLNAAMKYLTDDIPQPDDMDVTEWNATPIGRAVRRIQDALDQLEDAQ